MKWSEAYIPTLREAPQEAELVSHQLMMRAGLIRRVASGIYSFLPLGWKVIHKMQQIIREEMNAAGAQEVSLPVVQPKELWEESGRWAKYGKELARLRDRHDREFCLQPTAEEAVVDLVRRDLKSYKQLPFNLYQIQTKFRDEIRPRFGIMRGREFIMKDAYSFDKDEASARKSYEGMRQAYRRIFTRTGLDFRAVQADTGAIGGSDSEEFMVLAGSGEDEIIACTNCDYAANQEKAVAVSEHPAQNTKVAAPEKFATPGLKTIEDLAKSLSVQASDLMKSVVFTNDQGVKVLALCRGDHEVHPLKISNLLSKEKQIEDVRLARNDELEAWGFPRGSLGPYQIADDVLVVVDEAINENAAYVTGANEQDFHFKNVVLLRDRKPDLKACIRFVQSKENCVRCGKELQSFRGIEVGHVFYLGTKYSEAMKLEVSAESGSLQPVEMGCYGIGVGRSVAACIEQNHDQWGIQWPVNLAPYPVGVCSLDKGESEGWAKKYYDFFKKQGLDVLWDDRDLSPGVKLKDLDLIGVSLQVVIGSRSLKEGVAEFKVRATGEKQKVPLDDLTATVMAELNKYQERLDQKLAGLK